MENDETEIIVASKELPDRIHLLTAGSKPIFPGLMFPVVMGAGPEADILKTVNDDTPQKIVGFVLPKNENHSDSGEELSKELYRIGTAAKVLRLDELPDGTIQALCQGQKRFEILKVVEREGKMIGQVIYPEDTVEESDEVKALGMSIINTMRDLIQHNPLFSEEIKMFLSRTDWGDPGKLADFSVTMTASSREELQEVLESLDVRVRLEKALFLLRKELDLNELKERITHQIEEKISKQQREFFLREQLKAIKKELGLEKDEKEEEIDKYRARIEGLELPEEARDRIEEELEKLKLLSPQSPEFAVSRNYLDWLTKLPWGTHTEDKLDIRKARRKLDRDHYGLDDVKKRILEFIGVAKLKGSVEGSILCFVGPPGVGKTSLGRSIAEALGRKFFRFSLGGMRDEAEIKGHRRTYIGAMPGKVMQALKNTASANPVIMLDEIDKLATSFQGDPASALLEVLDPEQNSAFRDHYLDVPFDLSKVLFIATANVPDTIPGPLLDRMEVVNLSGYILQEKVRIAKRHLVAKQLSKSGLTKDNISFSDAALRTLVTGYAREAGVRNLEKAIGSCMRKVAAGLAEGTVEGAVAIQPDTVEDYLGKPRFTDDPLMKRGRPGVIMGLAWTSMGGTTLYVEAQAIPGKPGFKLTGQLGDVMKESASIAYSVVTSNAKAFGVKPSFFEDQTIHIHVPAGATPKDGPSAGITMASALISLARNRRAPAHWAMTGELTLTGRVLPIGGVKEKIIAAKRSKVKNIILPKVNEKDFLEIAGNVRRGVTPHFVEDYSEVATLLFKRT
ncbi:MAG: endopeptidase La [Lentisphaeria bacterium]|nr:endopeptidase La [Lentisphaeria bacterium]